MKAQAVGFWICTALVSFSFLSGGVSDVLQAPQVVEGMAPLGYPATSRPCWVCGKCWVG